MRSIVDEVRWLTRYDESGASSRYRAYQFDEGLRWLGWSSTFEPMAAYRASRAAQLRGVAGRIALLRRLGADPRVAITVVQKEPVMPPRAYRLVRSSLDLSSAPIVWDVDDAVWLGSSAARSMAVDTSRQATAVVAGNHLIAEWMASHTSSPVHIVPTCFEPSTSSRSTNRRTDSVRVVWIGSPATAPLLEPYGPVLDAALRAHESLHMEFVGGEPPHVVRGHPRVEATPWSPDSEALALGRADYGLAVMSRSEYADHKCGFKIVQYLANGVVPIASDNPVHHVMVTGAGCLISGPDDVETVLERLAARPSSAETAAALTRWQTTYSRERAVADWDRILREYRPASDP